MSNDELKKKIVKILEEGYTPIEYDDWDCGQTYFPTNEDVADALIAAGIGDVKEAEHRTEKTERAFRNYLAEYFTAVNEQNSYDCGIPEMFGRYVNVLPYEDIVTNMLNEYLQQAEKELAEERKDDEMS